MNVINLARTAYGQPLAPSRSPRSLEYELLARITQRLRLAWEKRDADFSGLALALRENVHLWTTLAADVAEEGNALPASLRAQLFYLYQFTEHHSQKILANQSGVEVLIDINTAVMRGLRGEQGGA